MKNLIFISGLLICFLSSCEAEKIVLSTEYDNIPVSQELKDYLKEIGNENYTFKNLNFAEGTLDDALQQAKQQDKYLYVVTTVGDDWQGLKYPLRRLDLNRRSEIQKDTFDKVLVYISSFSRDENKYLIWANNSIAFPMFFLFKDLKVVNFSSGFRGFNSSELLTNINAINSDSRMGSRLSLKGQNAIDFINLQIEAYNCYKNPNSTKQDLTLAYNSIKQALNMEETYFNHFLELELQKRLGLVDTEKTVSLEETKFYDKYSQYLFVDLK